MKKFLRKLIIRETIRAWPNQYFDMPVMAKDIKWSCLFGLVKIRYYVEQRYPDDSESSGKYKHFLDVFILRKRLNWTFRTKYLYEELPWED